jgi:hypothetical protein
MVEAAREMQGQTGSDSPNRVAVLIVAAAGIVIVVAVCSGVMFLVTTFLFAFSGGQYRMVPVVGYGALAVTVVTFVIAAVVWRLRSLGAAVKWAAIAGGVGWAIAVLVEWSLSFALGAD